MSWFKKKEILIEKAIVPRHEHNYKIIASKSEKYSVYTDSVARWHTHIIKQCECGDWITDYIDGKWTTEEIKRIK